MALKDIIAATETILKAVSGVGKIHAYERALSKLEQFNQLFLADDGKVHGWTITREATPEILQYQGGSKDKHRIVLRGYYRVNDEENSEKAFQDLVELIRDTFHSNPQLVTGSPAARAADWSDRASVRIVQHRKFGGVLCHYAEIVLVVTDKMVVR